MRRRCFPCCLWNHICEEDTTRAKNAKVAAVPNNAATDDGDTITVEAPPDALGLKFDGTSAIVKEVLFDSPLVGKVYPGDVLKSVNGVAVTGGKCIARVAAADDGTNPRTLLFLRKQQPARRCDQRPSSAWAPWKPSTPPTAPRTVQATLVPHATASRSNNPDSASASNVALPRYV